MQLLGGGCDCRVARVGHSTSSEGWAEHSHWSHSILLHLSLSLSHTIVHYCRFSLCASVTVSLSFHQSSLSKGLDQSYCWRQPACIISPLSLSHSLFLVLFLTHAVTFSRGLCSPLPLVSCSLSFCFTPAHCSPLTLTSPVHHCPCQIKCPRHLHSFLPL